MERTVFRPGVAQSIYLGFGPALVLLAGLAVIIAGPIIHPVANDRISIIGWGVGIAVAGGFWLAYIVGMSIEVDEERVSKAYLFGLVRVAIPLRYLSISAEKVRSRSGLVWGDRLDFRSSDGRGGGFSTYPGQVWHRRDMDKLLAIAASMEQWREHQPPPLRPEPPPSLGAFLKLAALWTTNCAVLAILPLVLIYSKWGALATLGVAGVIEVSVIGICARVSRVLPGSTSTSQSGGSATRGTSS